MGAHVHGMSILRDPRARKWCAGDLRLPAESGGPSKATALSSKSLATRSARTPQSAQVRAPRRPLRSQADPEGNGATDVSC